MTERCEVDRELVEAQRDCCPLCFGPAVEHLTALERLIQRRPWTATTRRRWPWRLLGGAR